MKKLFFLLLLLLFFPFLSAAQANEIGNPYQTSSSSEAEAIVFDESEEEVSLYQQAEAPEEVTENSSSATSKNSTEVVLPENILTADCLAFYPAKDIINLEEEPLYQKQSVFIKNLTFARQNRLRLNPQDTSLEEVNRSFITVNFTGDRLLALDNLKKEYSTAIGECLRAQAEEIHKAALLDLENKSRDGLEKINKWALRASQKIDRKIAARVTKIERKAKKRLARVEGEARITENNFKNQIRRANERISSGAMVSIYNKTLVSFKYKLEEELPNFVEKRRGEILAIKEQALVKTADKERELKDALSKKQEVRQQNLEKQIEDQTAVSEKLLQDNLDSAEKKASDKAESVYQARRTSVSGEGALVLERYNQVNSLITTMKKLWSTDKKKKLKELDASRLNLDNPGITVRGVATPSKSSNKQSAQKAAKSVKKSKAGNTKKGASLGKQDKGGSSTKGGKKSRDFGKADLTARVSWFNDSVTASGVSASDKIGVALNLKPGTASGWNNAKTDRWMLAARKGKPYYARVVIKGKSLVVPIIDKGPHENTGRGIDITLKAAERMGWSASNFPTDAVGKVYLLGQNP